MRRFVVGVVFGLLAVSIFSPQEMRATSASVVISQVYGGGGNSGATLKNDFIELFNRGSVAVSLAGWSVQYASATGTSWQVTNLSGSLAPGQYYLVREAVGAGGTVDLPAPDASGTIAMSATAGKVALVNATTALTTTGCPTPASVVDFVGFGTTANCVEGTAFASNLSNTTAALRLQGGCTETDNNGSDFAIGAPNPRNTSSPLNVCNGSTNPSGIGTADPTTVPSGDTVTLRVTVTPGSNPTSVGLTVTANLVPIGGSSTQAFTDIGGGVFSFDAVVPPGTVPGAKSIAFVISDSIGRTGGGTIALTVVGAPLTLPIHEIQGAGATSTHVGQFIRTEGIVTAVRFNNGFFMQAPDGAIDGDPNTSEGVFVFTNSAPPATAAVGNLVQVTATVAEFIPSADPLSLPATELTTPTVALLSTGNALPSAMTLTPADTNPLGGLGQLERFEGMRVHVDALTVVAPTQGTVNEASASSTSSGVYFGVVAGVARPFREAGVELPEPLPPASPCCVTRFDGNPEKIRVDSNGNAAVAAAATTEVMSGALVSGITGVLDYSSHAYTILPDPDGQGTVTGLHGYTPVSAAAAHRFTVATANLERFFDTTNDAGISDVQLTGAAYAARLLKVGLQVCDVMRAPDIIGVEEVENLTVLQNIAAAANGTASCGGTHYVAYLFEGNDPGGIDDGLLVNADRVQVNSVHQEGKTATYTDPNGIEATLNDRPPTVLEATITVPGHSPQDIIVIANHLRSLNGVDDDALGGDGPRVRLKRLKQAEFLGHLIESLQTANGAPIVAVGDFNAFEFSDGYVDVIGTIKGTPVPANQVVLSSTDVPNTAAPLSDLIETVSDPTRYSYVFDGSAQSLDHVLATQAGVGIFDHIEWGHSNADFPETLRADATRPERLSDHDPVVAYFVLAADTVTTVAASPNPADFAGDVTFTAAVVSADGPVSSGFVHFTDGAGFSASSAVVNGVASVTTAAGPFGLGTHTITAEYSDGVSFGPSSGSAAFTVADLTPPPVPVLSVTPDVLSTPNHKMVGITVTAQSTDAVSGPATCAITAISSNEPDNGLGDGDTAGDIGPIAGLTTSLRAERSGVGDGRVYTVTVACQDAAGNTSTSSIGVAVPKNNK